jgi:uncharacterized protein
MKIVVFGASGMIGSHVVQEALNRGHEVTAVTHDPSKLEIQNPKLSSVAGDVLDPASVEQVSAGHDAAVSAARPNVGDEPAARYTEAARTLVETLPRVAVRRLVYVGGASSLEVAPGVQLFDTDTFEPAWKIDANSQRKALAFFRNDAGEIDWTYFSPAGYIAPGERTGHYRVGGNQLVTDAEGKSYISAEDYAVALIDELENPQHIRQRFTVAY